MKQGVYLNDGRGERQPLHLVDGWSPAWSSDGSRIAFVHPEPRGIAVVDLASGESHPVVLSGSMTLDADPQWALNDEAIVFLRAVNPFGKERVTPTGYYIVRLDGLGLRLLAPRVVGRLEWSKAIVSPDGDSLALEEKRARTSFGRRLLPNRETSRWLRTVNIDHFDETVPLLPGVRRLRFPWRGMTIAQWNRRYGVVAYPHGPDRRLYAFDPDATAVCEAIVTLPEIAWRNGIALSADGRRIAFIGKDGTEPRTGPRRDENQLFTMSLEDNLDIDRLTTTRGVHGSPAWSPDGQRLAYEFHLSEAP